ncbi:MAG: hypothetical protein JHC98_03740 [Thermoleophilaceae bacterium]|nr:hypothetical protein [Thermoleophilaceae bacterium]
MNGPNGLLDQLRDLPTLFDVVVGDFGREAATRYLAIMAEEERAFLTRLLATQDLPFLDEYRRIMFGHIGDVAYLKRVTVQRVWAEQGRLTDEVLVAVKAHDIPSDMVARFACVIHDEAVLAMRRGHGRVRVALPCNALSETLGDAVRVAGEARAFKAAAESVDYEPISDDAVPELTAHGVVHSTIGQLERTGMLDGRPFVVLGAAMANEQYRRLGGPRGMNIILLTELQQAIVDEAVLACIDGSDANLATARQAIEGEILTPLRRLHPGLVVLEACTDFDFGLGLDSLRLMARQMVFECYRDLQAASDLAGPLSEFNPILRTSGNGIL